MTRASRRDVGRMGVSERASPLPDSTPKGEARVNFLLTRQGLEIADEALESGNSRLLSDDPEVADELAALAMAARRNSGGYVN